MEIAPAKVSLASAFDQLEYLPDRVPGDDRTATTAGGAAWFAQVSPFRDGAVFIVHYAGQSEWERHRGDEIVMVMEGHTTMTMALETRQAHIELGPLELVVVPQGTWHCFDTPTGAKIMTVTPTPTDHALELPE